MPMIDGLAPEFEYRFHGDHALGGRRTSRASMIRWWERATTLLPGARFDLQDILVKSMQSVSHWALLAREYHIVDPEIDRWSIQAFFATLTNVNFDPERFIDYIHKSDKANH